MPPTASLVLLPARAASLAAPHYCDCVQVGSHSLRLCGDLYGYGFACTRPRGHNGCHTACGPFQHAIVSWLVTGNGEVRDRGAVRTPTPEAE